MKRLAMQLFTMCFLILVMNGCGKSNPEEKCSDRKTMKVEAETEGEDENKTSAAESTDVDSDSNVTSSVSVFDGIGEQAVSGTTSSSTSTSQKNTTSVSSFNKIEQHTHIWETVSHPEEGHYEIEVINEAYDEEVSRTFCNRCKDSSTGKPLDITVYAIEHVISVCGGGYYADRITIHHDAETKEVWVVDKEAWMETKCSCGATK